MATRAAAAVRAKAPGASETPLPEPKRKAARVARDDAQPVASHVHELHDLLEAQFVANAPSRSAPRATLVYILIASVSFWIGVALTVSAHFH